MQRRREFMESAVSLLFLAALPVAVACRPQGPVCSDEDLLSTPEQALRDSHEYTEHSPLGPEQSCASCQFFQAVESAACGVCQLLGGPVNSAGRCNAWAAKA